MTTFSSWPHPRPEPPPIPKTPSLKALLLCPTEPHEHFDRVRDFISQEGTNVCASAGIAFELVRIMDVRYPGIITKQTWDEISYSDIIFLDLSGLNPNVLIELGVASAWRPPFDVVPIFNESLHLLRISPERNKYPHEIFDVAQLRHYRYDFSTDQGVNKFMAAIRRIFSDVLAAVPQEWPPVNVPPKPINWKNGEPIPPSVKAPPRCHFMLDGDGLLSFGAPFYFPASYIRLTRSKSRNSIVRTTFQFKPVKNEFGNPLFDDYWVGIKVRASNTFVEYGHLVFIRPDGNVHRVRIPIVPPPPGEQYHDEGPPIIQLGTIDVEKDWITLTVESTDRRFSISADKNAGPLVRAKPDDEIPSDDEHVEFEGYSLIQTFRTRAILNKIYFREDLPPEA